VEDEPDIWTASITDVNSNREVSLGQLRVVTESNWTDSVTGVWYQEAVPNQACHSGLAPSTMHFKPAIANESFVMEKFRPTTWPDNSCVAIGGGFEEGDRIIDGGRSYSVSLGESR